MITIDDIIKRSNYINQTNKTYNSKVKILSESNVYRFEDKKYILSNWQCLHEDQVECFKKVIDILEESVEQNRVNDFNYIKSYIINEVAPTVRDAKQTIRYLKYKTTRMKNKIKEKIEKNKDEIRDNTQKMLDNIRDTNSQSISTIKNNVKKDIGKEEVHEAYIEILDSLDKYNHCDRILENAYNIQKRFNIMSMVTKTDINNDIELSNFVDTVYECINTYDATTATKLNSMLETCFYFLSRKDKNFNKKLVLEQTMNNFLSKDMTDEDIIGIRSIIESSIVFTSEDKTNINYIFNCIPYEENTELAKVFENTEVSDTLNNISCNISDNDVRKVFASVRNNISSTNKEDVELLLKKLSCFYTGENFNKLCNEEVNTINTKYIKENEELIEFVRILSKYDYNNEVLESSLVMNLVINEDSKVKNSVKDIISSFKMAKIKKATDVRTCVSKMFTKSPDQIIDGTPNFLSWTRSTYILGATAINPILGAITLLVDQFIAMKLKRRDVSKMITVFKNELKTVDSKISKAEGKDKENLKEYKKYLEKGIDKLEEYEESLLSSGEKEARYSDEEYERGSDLKDMLDIDSDDDDDDFNLEATSFEVLFEKSNFLSKKYFSDNIEKYISIMNEDTIDTITDIICKYPVITNKNTLYSILREEYENISGRYSKNWIKMTCLSSNMRKLTECNTILTSADDIELFEIMNGLEDLFVEYSISKSLKPTNESASSSIKLLSNKLRNAVQKASDMDKEASRKIDGSVNTFVSAMQRSVRNDNREAIIRGSIIPSASKVVKTAILDTGVALVNPAIAIILALGQFAMSKKMKVKERQLVLDEIDIELEMCKRYLRQAEDQNDLEAQKKILRIQRNLERQKQRIQYNMKIKWNQDVPNVVTDND